MDERTRDFLGLPIFKPLYGFGDSLTLRARMVTAFLGGADSRALAGALPAHPLVKLNPLAPLMVVQTDFSQCTDNADPDGNNYRYREVMLAVLLQAERGKVVGPMFPLVLFVDQPIAMAAGREFHGFPKVPAEIRYGACEAEVKYAAYPGGERTPRDVMRSTWAKEPGLVGRVLGIAGDVVKRAASASGIDSDTADLVTQLALAPLGEVWNLRQVPDLQNPRRAVFSQLTRFVPKITEPGEFSLLQGYKASFPDEPIWSLGRRFFRNAAPRTILAFRWDATMTVAGGEIVDTWLG